MEEHMMRALMFAIVPVGLAVVAAIIAQGIKRWIPNGRIKDRLYR